MALPNHIVQRPTNNPIDLLARESVRQEIVPQMQMLGFL